MGNRSVLLFIIMIISGVVFILIGVCLLCAPEMKKSKYRRARAVIVSRVSDDGGLFPIVKYYDGEQEIETHLIYSMKDSPEKREGYEFDVLYCPKKLLGIPVHSAMEDDGKSMKRTQWLYGISGVFFIIMGVGLLLFDFLVK